MIKKIKAWVNALLNSKLVRIPVKWSQRIPLPGFHGMSLYAVLNFVITTFTKSNYGMRSSAIAFKFFLALFPGLMFFVSLIPFIPIENFQTNLMEEIKVLTPASIYMVIEQTINDLIHNKHHWVLGLGGVLTLFYASNGIDAMLSAFNTSHQIDKRRNPLKQRLISLGIFGAFSVFIVIMLAAITYGEVFVQSVEYKKLGSFMQILFQLGKWGTMLLSMVIAVGTLYNLGNPQITSYKWFSPGSSLASILIVLVSIVISYFFTNFSQYNELYGSIGSLMMIMIWLNAVSYVLLIGFELHTLKDFQRVKLEEEKSISI
ncbi:MAG: YihY/virulence factor BrkB family protein [Flavobacteriales bacterium]|nr:YihY/virulence factor BrkB family protein [Flavobacteriales bacterium]